MTFLKNAKKNLMKTRFAYENNKYFPRYSDRHTRRVDIRFLNLAKCKATIHFSMHIERFKQVYKRYLTRKMHCKPSAVKFDKMSTSITRIQNAVLQDVDDCYGWTDGSRIYISTILEMSFNQVVSTLIHEELHCFCKVRGKALGAQVEHHCMKVLGEVF